MVAPKYIKSHVYKVGNATAPIAVQLYLDYACPFSAKMFKKVNSELIPLLEKTYPGKVQVEFYHVIQPWHPTSNIEHEVALAVAKVYPDKFWKFSEILFEDIADFKDVPNYDLSRRQITDKLIKVGATKLGFDEAKLWEVLKIHEDNSGTDVTKDVKYFTRFHRTTGVHVTPSLFVDGIPVPTIESSTPAEKILEILGSYL